MPEIQLGSRTVFYQVRESSRARRVSLKIDPQQGLEIILPPGIFIENPSLLLLERKEWILKHLERFGQFPASNGKRRFVSGESLFYLGESHTLEVTPTRTSKRISVARQSGLLRVRLPAIMPPGHPSAHIRDALENWYRNQAMAYILPRVAHLAAQHGFEYQRVTIKGQRTRWGSCSSNGNLNFNYRLMMTPPGAIDYVILHELCHLRELNHSPRFWAMVRQLCPDYAYWVRWLDEHSPQLML